MFCSEFEGKRGREGGEGGEGEGRVKREQDNLKGCTRKLCYLCVMNRAVSVFHVFVHVASSALLPLQSQSLYLQVLPDGEPRLTPPDDSGVCVCVLACVHAHAGVDCSCSNCGSC